jgi:structural maintenance of chromosome 3 (chondroitin sulfate proteoglycan 6)
MKKTKITELMDFIIERMDELEKEKKELRLYQTKDRERRCIQYSIFTKDQQEADKNLEDVSLYLLTAFFLVE